MITIRQWNASTLKPAEMNPEQFVMDRLHDSALVWVDLVGDEPEAHRQFMQQQLGLPKLAVDDALRVRHPPKYEPLTGGWRFLLMRGFDIGSTSIKFGTIQLAVFWHDNLLITRHAKPSASVAALEEALRAEHPLQADRVWNLLYMMLRKLLDLYLPITLKIEARLEEIEELLLSRPSDRQLGELMEFSSQLKRLRRIGAYHEKCFASMRAHAEVLDDADSAQLTDLHEQAERLHSLSSLLYETDRDLIDGYLSVSSHRLNKVMRILTVVTVIFVPLTFIAGVYGMNFQFIPELAWHWGYFVVLGVMLSVAITLLVVFRRKGWI